GTAATGSPARAAARSPVGRWPSPVSSGSARPSTSPSRLGAVCPWRAKTIKVRLSRRVPAAGSSGAWGPCPTPGRSAPLPLPDEDGAAVLAAGKGVGRQVTDAVDLGGGQGEVAGPAVHADEAGSADAAVPGPDLLIE